jgi:hypothetical protein
LGSPAEWKRIADRFRARLWERFRSPKLLKRLRGREQAVELLEGTLEREIDDASTMEENG